MTTVVAMKDLMTRRWVLYADSRLSEGMNYVDSYRKVFAVDGFAWGASGSAMSALRLQAVKTPERHTDFLPALLAKQEGEGGVRLLVTNGDQLWYLDSLGFHYEITGTTFFAVGSGSEFAKGALAMGADALRAIEIAAQFDAGTGGPIHSAHPGGSA